MSAVRRKNAQELLCGAVPASLLDYAAVLHIHAVTGLRCPNNNVHNDDPKISIQIARCTDELPLLTTKPQPMSKPLFEEVLVVHTNTLEKLELLLCSVEDVLDEYELDLDHHRPHHPHHLALQGQSTTLYITLIIKLSRIPPSPSPAHDIQILVQYLETPLPQIKGPVVIAASNPCSEPFHKIDFFSRGANKQIHLSMPQGPSDQPQWHHTFLFTNCQLNEKIGILLFHSSKIDQDNNWNLGESIGHTLLPLTQSLLSLLKNSQDGVGFTNVPIVSPHSNALTLRIVIRLGVGPPLLPGALMEQVPLMKWGDKEKEEVKEEREVECTPPEDNLGLPSHTAIMQLLEKHLPRSRTVSHSSTQLEPDMLDEGLVEVDGEGRREEKREEKRDEYAHLTSVIKQQSDELKQYRGAVQKMGNDIMLCRDQIIQLKKDKAALTERLKDIECVVPSIDLSRLPADKLVYECVAAQNKYTAQVQRCAQLEYKARALQSTVQKLKKDNVEVEELRHAHTAQNQLLQKLQEKVKVTQILEKTCKDQEKIIEKLESFLHQQVPSQPPTKHISFAPRPQILDSTRLSQDSFYRAPAFPNDIPAIPKLEPLDSILPPWDKQSSKKVSPEGSVSSGTIAEDMALRLRVGALENQLHLAQLNYQQEAQSWAEDRMDLQLQLALIKREER